MAVSSIEILLNKRSDSLTFSAYDDQGHIVQSEQGDHKTVLLTTQRQLYQIEAGDLVPCPEIDTVVQFDMKLLLEQLKIFAAKLGLCITRPDEELAFIPNGVCSQWNPRIRTDALAPLHKLNPDRIDGLTTPKKTLLIE